MFKHGASYLQGGDFRFHCYSIPNSVDERLGPLLKNFAAGCNWRFMQGYSKVPTSAHSAYIGVYVFAASTGRCNPLQANRSLLGHPTGGPSLRDGHSQLSHTLKRIGSAREKRMENDFLVNCSTPFLVASRSDATPCQDSWSREAQNMTT